jgi:hypothetical protein
MAIEMPDRIAQIAFKFTPATQEGALYTPSSASVLGTSVNYQGYMAVLRCAAYIDSLSQVFVPIDDPGDTTARREQKAQLFRANPKKGLLISLRGPANEDFEVGIIDLFNVKPIFLSGINEYFTDLELYGIKFGWKIQAKIVDRGHGLLQNNTGEGQQNDWVSVTGFVVEKSGFLQDHNNVVYNFT